MAAQAVDLLIDIHPRHEQRDFLLEPLVIELARQSRDALLEAGPGAQAHLRQACRDDRGQVDNLLAAAGQHGRDPFAFARAHGGERVERLDEQALRGAEQRRHLPLRLAEHPRPAHQLDRRDAGELTDARAGAGRHFLQAQHQLVEQLAIQLKRGMAALGRSVLQRGVELAAPDPRA